MTPAIQDPFGSPCSDRVVGTIPNRVATFLAYPTSTSQILGLDPALFAPKHSAKSARPRPRLSTTTPTLFLHLDPLGGVLGSSSMYSALGAGRSFASRRHISHSVNGGEGQDNGFWPMCTKIIITTDVDSIPSYTNFAKSRFNITSMPSCPSNVNAPLVVL